MLRQSRTFLIFRRLPILVLDISQPMPTILFSAPYMLPYLDRFRPVLEHSGLKLITPEVQERLEETELLKYAG